jgi:hypothetical protein
MMQGNVNIKSLITDLGKYLDKVKYKWFILYFKNPTKCTN